MVWIVEFVFKDFSPFLVSLLKSFQLFPVIWSDKIITDSVFIWLTQLSNIYQMELSVAFCSRLLYTSLFFKREHYWVVGWEVCWIRWIWKRSKFVSKVQSFFAGLSIENCDGMSSSNTATVAWPMGTYARWLDTRNNDELIWIYTWFWNH